MDIIPTEGILNASPRCTPAESGDTINSALNAKENTSIASVFPERFFTPSISSSLSKQL